MSTRYNRSQILNSDIKFETDFINLVYSFHANQRLEERLNGNLLLKPTIVKVTKNNIYCGATNDGETLYEVVIRLRYKPSEWCFLAILPHTGFVKTVYFRPLTKKKAKCNISPEKTL